MDIKDGVFHAIYDYVDKDVIRGTRPPGVDFDDCNPSFVGLCVVQCKMPGMPNKYRFELDDDETENIYPPFVIPLGSSGVIKPGVLIFNHWIDHDPRTDIFPL